MSKFIKIIFVLLFPAGLFATDIPSTALSVSSSTYSTISALTGMRGSVIPGSSTVTAPTQTSIQNKGTGSVYYRTGSTSTIVSAGTEIKPGWVFFLEDNNAPIYIQSDTVTNDIRYERKVR